MFGGTPLGRVAAPQGWHRGGRRTSGTPTPFTAPRWVVMMMMMMMKDTRLENTVNHQVMVFLGVRGDGTLFGYTQIVDETMNSDR